MYASTLPNIFTKNLFSISFFMNFEPKISYQSQLSQKMSLIFIRNVDRKHTTRKQGLKEDRFT